MSSVTSGQCAVTAHGEGGACVSEACSGSEFGSGVGLACGVLRPESWSWSLGGSWGEEAEGADALLSSCFRRKIRSCSITRMKWTRTRRSGTSGCVRPLCSSRGADRAGRGWSECWRLTGLSKPIVGFEPFFLSEPLVRQSRPSRYIRRRTGSFSMSQRRTSGWSWYVCARGLSEVKPPGVALSPGTWEAVGQCTRMKTKAACGLQNRVCL